MSATQVMCRSVRFLFPVQALEEGSGLCPRDGGVAEKESGCRVPPPYRRDDSLEILEYGDHRARAHHPGSEGEHFLLNFLSLGRTSKLSSLCTHWSLFIKQHKKTLH